MARVYGLRIAGVAGRCHDGGLAWISEPSGCQAKHMLDALRTPFLASLLSTCNDYVQILRCSVAVFEPRATYLLGTAWRKKTRCDPSDIPAEAELESSTFRLLQPRCMPPDPTRSLRASRLPCDQLVESDPPAACTFVRFQVKAARQYSLSSLYAPPA